MLRRAANARDRLFCRISIAAAGGLIAAAVAALQRDLGPGPGSRLDPGVAAAAALAAILAEGLARSRPRLSSGLVLPLVYLASLAAGLLTLARDAARAAWLRDPWMHHLLRDPGRVFRTVPDHLPWLLLAALVLALAAFLRHAGLRLGWQAGLLFAGSWVPLTFLWVQRTPPRSVAAMLGMFLWVPLIEGLLIGCWPLLLALSELGADRQPARRAVRSGPVRGVRGLPPLSA